MKHPKRFCVECDKETFTALNRGMYYCRACGEEVCREGDGIPKRNFKRVDNVDVRSLFDREAFQELNITETTRANPELLSDEHIIWKSRPADSEEKDKEKSMAILSALKTLTKRQKEVLMAIQRHKTQERAAIALRISQQSLSKSLGLIRKKIGCILDIKGQYMEGIERGQ